MNLTNLKNEWEDTPKYHRELHNLFVAQVDANPELKAHRDFIQNHVYGFGERSFWWLWKLILDELPLNFSFLEIGCFKGATLSVIKLIRSDAEVIGITPLDSTGIGWEDDYRQRIHDIHDRFNDKNYPEIIQGRSDDAGVIAYAQTRTYDLIYIDGGHLKEDIDNDLNNYAAGVRKGGYLVVDDCANDLNMDFGVFQGIDPVTVGVNEYMAEHGNDWDFITNVVHIKVFQRK